MRNSALIARYVRFSPIVRPFLIFLKTWAKQRGLNDPSGSKGPMSLSSYSLLLMAIGYLQHRGVVPNLQDPALLSRAGQKREAFWTKVPNRNAIAPGARGRGRFLGDFKAMVVETSFVRTWNREWDWKPSFPPSEGSYDPNPQPSGVSHSRSPQPGWKSPEPSAALHAAGATAAVGKDGNRETHLVNLIEGFFGYYLGFPLEELAVSIWAGKPISRASGYLPLAADEEGHILPQLPKVTREEREELYEEAAADQEEDMLSDHHTADAAASGRSQSDSQHGQESALPGTESTSTDDEEDMKAKLAEMDALLRAHGVQQLGPSFEERHKLEKTARAVADQAAAAREAFESAFPEPSPLAQRLANMSLDSPKPQPQRGPAVGSSMLELRDAQAGSNLFPFPEQEDPAKFVEPPHWTQRLVVQDPFIHTRNTCMNIIPRTVDRILVEMHRAHELLQESAPLEQICLNIGKDEVYSEYAAGLVGGLNPSRAARRYQREQKEKDKRKRDEAKIANRERRRAEFESRQAAGAFVGYGPTREKRQERTENGESEAERKQSRREKGKQRWLEKRTAAKEKKMAEKQAQKSQQQSQQAAT